MTVINANALSNFVSLQCLSSLLNALLQNTMAEQNIPAQPPTRTDEQIVPRSQWLTIGKSNLLFNAQKIQKNPIFQISNGEFIVVKLMKQWFDLSADSSQKGILRITPVIPATPFGVTSVCSANAVGNRHSKLNVDHAELIWEEFTQGIQTFTHTKQATKLYDRTKRRSDPLLIPYGRFSKVIIYYLASNNNIHRRPDSAVHHTGDDYVLGNLKFVPKGESVEVFGMAIPIPLITEAIQQSSYYPKYLKMVAENTKKTPQGSASVQPATKACGVTTQKATKPPHQSKIQASSSLRQRKPSKRKLLQKIRKGKPTFQHLLTMKYEARQVNDPDLDLA
ncbi:hypothetical protein Tco_0922335 [Tanacetum coccineum]|uniref:Uncharacterized protein n=1 Tax=Tanacetum coccineum TaxID=301880 RepID=A0ABQ5CXY5_9ASTR